MMAITKKNVVGQPGQRTGCVTEKSILQNTFNTQQPVQSI